MTRNVLIGVLLAAFGCAKAKNEEPSPSAPAKQAEPVAVTTASLPAEPRAVTAPAITPAASGHSARCRAACEPVYKLGCKLASECESSCREMMGMPRCREEIGAFFGCLSSQGAERWECLEDGTGAIREGYCEREQARFAACLEKNDVQ
jgi:hypothetical protein